MDIVAELAQGVNDFSDFNFKKVRAVDRPENSPETESLNPFQSIPAFLRTAAVDAVAEVVAESPDIELVVIEGESFNKNSVAGNRSGFDSDFGMHFISLLFSTI